MTFAIVPLAVHTPAANVEVTVPDVPVLSVPALTSESVNVTVTLALSTSLTTMFVRSSGVSSVYVSGADRFVATGAKLAGWIVTCCTGTKSK